MSKLKSVLVAVVLLSAFLVTPAFSDVLGGCKTGLFIGSFNALVTYPDIWGDGSNVENQTINQLTLHIDGTATQTKTVSPDLMLSLGFGWSEVGSWTCRSDGKLVVTLIFGGYRATTDAVNHPATVPNPPPVDLLLVEHEKDTYLFSVTDANTLTRIKFRRRDYSPTEDPTNPTAGTLEPLVTDVVVYKRLKASDADLLAP
jgi:hypothetical protein